MKNRYEVRGDVTAVFVNCRGSVVETLIDTDDLPLVDSFPNSWYGRLNTNSKIYVVGQRLGKETHLHRLITDCPDGREVDHIDHDPLNNRRANLRAATKSENMLNRTGVRADAIHSGVRGAAWIASIRKFEARFKINGRTISLGFFDTAEEAGQAVKIGLSVVDDLRDLIWPAA